MAQERISEHNQPMVEEFRSNAGRIGGPFEGHTMLLLHNRGRRTGVDNVNPLAYLPDAEDPATVYVFASAAGRPEHPQWSRSAPSGSASRSSRSPAPTAIGSTRYRSSGCLASASMSVACKAAGQYPYSRCVGPADRLAAAARWPSYAGAYSCSGRPVAP
jgi:hypothetical protein